MNRNFLFQRVGITHNYTLHVHGALICTEYSKVTTGFDAHNNLVMRVGEILVLFSFYR